MFSDPLKYYVLFSYLITSVVMVGMAVVILRNLRRAQQKLAQMRSEHDS